MSLLGVDIGTSGVRAVCYDTAGNELASASIATPLTHSPGGRVETQPEGVMEAVEASILAVTSQLAASGDVVTALSFAVQGEAVVPVDSGGRALAAAPVSLDRRGIGVEAALRERLGTQEIRRITGQPPHPMFSIYKIASGSEGWSGVHVAGYRCLDAFVAARMGADPATDYSMAARTGAFDVDTLCWSEPILSAASTAAGYTIPPTSLPKVVPAGTVIGTVSLEAAARCGLRPDVEIVAGAHDQAASFIGAGGQISRRAVFALGTSDCLTVSTARRPAGIDNTGFASYPIGKGRWITLAGTAAGGWSLEWLAELLGTKVPELFANISDTPPQLLVLPYLAGSGTLDNDPNARGVIAGMTLATTREQIARAFLEANGFDLAKILAAFATSNIEVGDIVAVGTGSGNRAALEIRASAAGVRLAPVRGHSSARGAAFLAGIGNGTFTDIDALPRTEPEAPSEPDSRHEHWYEQQRAVFAELYQSTLAITHHLSQEPTAPRSPVPSGMQ